MIRLLLIMVSLVMGTSVWAQEAKPIAAHSTRAALKTVTLSDVQSFKALLADVDHKTVDQTVNDINRTPYPFITLKIRQAMAQTYHDIVTELKVVGQGKREWLYSMITLNMAYLQFEGQQTQTVKTTALNNLICTKLRAYLTPQIMNHPGFHSSLE